MEALEAARVRWKEEQGLYDQFLLIVERQLDSAIKLLGIPAKVDSRTKDLDSLVKKLILKPKHTYESLPDKAGIRAIVRYLDEVPAVEQAARQVFEVSDAEDKIDALGYEKVGYLGRHLDLRFGRTDPSFAAFPADKFRAELQIRTLGQHVWAEMAHGTVYKGGEGLPVEAKRRIYLQAALMEVADMEFSRVARDIAQMPGMEAVQTMQELEKRYYRLTSVRYDAELSILGLGTLLPLYAGSADLLRSVDEYLQDHDAVFEAIFSEQAQLPDTRSVFVFQPEVLSIVERLSHDPRRLRDAFVPVFGYEELDRLANIFGMSLD